MLNLFLLRSTAATASLLALLATLGAWGCWLLAPAAFTSLDWAPYDAWLRLRTPQPLSPAILIVTRDAASEARFGTGARDHAVMARAITALSRAGAAVIGLDVQLGGPSPPGRGGASSDAMLIEATRESGRVVYSLFVRPVLDHQFLGDTSPVRDLPLPVRPVLMPELSQHLRQASSLTGPLPPLSQYAHGLGHTVVIPDKDGVNRKVPLYVMSGDRALPAFGMALAIAFLQVSPEQISIKADRITLPQAQFSNSERRDLSIPTDEHGQMLINYISREAGRPLPSLSFLEIWEAITQGETEKLREWVGGKIVVFLAAEQTMGLRRTPVEETASPGMIQVNALNTLLTQAWGREMPSLTAALAAMALSGLAAWLWLSIGGWIGPMALGGLTVGYVGLVLLTLWLGGLVLPALIPIAALLLASGGATLWMQLTASQRIRMLEGNILRAQQELTAVREALVYRESIVERLEEDVEAARTAAARSAGKEQELARSAEVLKMQLAEAQGQEETTRRLLRKLEHELAGLRAVTSETERLGDGALERLREECAQMDILTRDPKILSLFHDLKKAARSQLPVLLLGEPGTGKELFARAVHRLSPRAGRPFVPVNMAAISPELFESELFGHVRGSFTGALGDRKGYFEQAHQGTIFLDEIGDLRLDHQGKLLRVLQEKTFYRVGDIKLTSIDVRVVAATNKDLQRGVAEGWFREDLYFRLKGLVLRLPPLRERLHDLPLLAERFVTDAAAQIGRSHVTLSQEALTALKVHEWKGNVRELQHCLEQAVALSEGPVITREDLRLAPHEQAFPPATKSLAPAIDASGDTAVLDCLRRHEFDMQATAKTVGWDRSTVTQRLKGLSFRALVEAEGDQSRAARALAGEPALIRTVELKLMDYYEHLIKTIQGFRSADEAIIACKKRFKNLPDRHFQSVEVLVREYFSRSQRPS